MNHLSHRVRLLWAAALFLVVLIAAPIPVRAQDETPNPTAEPTAEGTAEGVPQGPITFEALFIRLWPEYDRPSMLVQYQGVLSLETEGEVELEFTMPEGSEFLVAAVLDADGAMLDATGLYSVEGQVITFLSPNGTFHVEFYAPLDLSAERRSYTHTWSEPYAVNDLYWVMQEPRGAEEFATSSASVPGNPDALGLSYFRAEAHDVPAGQAETMTVTYIKTDSRLTCEQINCTPPQAAPQTGSTPTGGINIDNNTIAVAALVLVGLGLVGGGVYLYRRNRTEEDAYFEERRAPYRERPLRRAERRRASAARSVGHVDLFCTQCGTQAADPSDKFCRRCGAPLRSAAS